MEAQKGETSVLYKFDMPEEEESKKSGTGGWIVVSLVVAFGLYILVNVFYFILFGTEAPLIHGDRSEMIWNAGKSLWRGIFFIVMGIFFWHLFSKRKADGMIYGVLGLSIFGLDSFYTTLHRISQEQEAGIEGFTATAFAFLAVIALLSTIGQLDRARKWNFGKISMKEDDIALDQAGVPWQKRIDLKKRVLLQPERTDHQNGNAELLVQLRSNFTDMPNQMKLYLEFENEEAGKAFMENLKKSEGSEEGTA